MCHESSQHPWQWFSGSYLPTMFAIELEHAHLGFGRELEQIIYYEGISVGTRRADFIVENSIVVEIKAVINLEDVHLAQAKNYVVAYDIATG